MNAKIREIIKLLSDFTTHRTRIFNLLKERCSENVVFSGILGNYIGTKEIYQVLNAHHDNFPIQASKILKTTTYKNVFQFHVIFTMIYHRSLPKNSHLLTPKSSGHPLLQRLSTIPPQHQQLLAHMDITYVKENDRIVFIHIETDPLDIINQLQGDVVDPKRSIGEYTQFIQSHFREKLTPMEIQCLSFSLCGFSSKQTSPRLFLSHRTIETYLQNAHAKIGCKTKGECLEMMYKNQLIHYFQKLCFELMNKPKNAIRNVSYE